MKITELTGIGIEQIHTGQAKAVEGTRTQKPPDHGSGGVDVLHFSPQARLLNQAAQIVRDTPEVRPEKVLALKDSVEQGTYTVDTTKVANKLIVEMLTEKA
ncbi:MAG: flagellar biosynthesis anti-sigma factor FlgM [Syntrophobacterales bacterium]|nr:flagellar biosynthesis anti-sigma factor FlgM [Syntrophobacterales bacterium]